MFTKEIENTYAISVSKSFLKDLEEILNKHFTNIYCTAMLKNQDRIDFESITSLSEYENALEKRIVKLDISAYESESKNLHLFFENKEKTSMHGIISAKDKNEVNSIYNKIDYAIRRKSEGIFFSRMAQINYFEMLYLILVLLIVTFGFFSPSTQSSNTISMVKLLTEYFVPMVELVAIYMGLGALVYKAKNYMWPMIVFNIGDEIEKNEKRKTLKKNLVWAVFLAILVSVIGNFIYAKITNR